MRPWDGRTLGNWWRVRGYRAATGRGRADRFVYPHVLRYRRHAEFGCHSLIPDTTLEELVSGFEEARRPAATSAWRRTTGKWTRA